MTDDIISAQPELILLDISHNYCGTATVPVQNLLFRRCLLVICYWLTELLKRFPSVGREARANNNCKYSSSQ
jgi:hypothetical protein